jgi:hypothetical protein
MRTTWLLVALAALLALLALSGFRPYDRATWALKRERASSPRPPR